MAEASVEAHLVRVTKRHGGWALKFTSPGTAGVPDRIVLLPGGRIAFIELKRRGKVAEKLQDWVQGRLRRLGFRVATLDTHDKIDAYFAEWLSA